MSRCIVAAGLLLCLFACTEKAEEPDTGNAPVAEKSAKPPAQDKVSEKPDKPVILAPAKRFAPYEYKLATNAGEKPLLTGSVPDKVMTSEDGRLLGVVRGPAGEYSFKAGEMEYVLEVADQPHALPDVPVACDRACACALGGRIYLFGGRIERASHSGFAHCYDPGTKKWRELPSMLPRQRAAAAALEGKIYVIGGHAGDDTPVVEIYDSESGEWSDGPPLKAARYGACAAVAGGRLYCIGGWLSCSHKHIGGKCGGDPTGVVEVFDPEKGTWERASAMPTARAFAACAAMGKKICVAGGYRGSGEVSILEIFDTQSGAWEKGPNMPGAAACCASCELDNRLFVFGGSRGKEYLAEVVSYDPESGKWRKEEPLDFARESTAAAVVDGKAYLFGGLASALLLPAAEMYQSANSGGDGGR